MKKTMIAALVAVSGATAVHAATINQANPNGSRSTADWNQTSTINASNPGPTWTGAVVPTAGNDYVANARLNSPTSGSPVTFAGDSLELSGVDAQFQMRSTSSANTVTIGSLILNGGGVVPNQDATGANFATLAGGISVIADSYLSNLQNAEVGSGAFRNTRYESTISGANTLTLRNNAPGFVFLGSSDASLVIANAGNTFSGVWDIERTRAIFTSAGAVGAGSLNVNADAYLRIDDSWNGAMTVVDGALVEVGDDAADTYTFDQGDLVVGGSAFNTLGTYTAAELNTATGTSIFSGAGSIEVIPEPATLGLVAAFGGAVLFIRRRFMI